jgi:cobalt-zinc-cadmium efflux system outer membrane protein
LQNPVFGAGVAFPIAGSAQTGFGFSVSQDFLSVFLLAARKKVAEAELRATERRVGDAVLRMANEVEVAFCNLAAAQQIAAMRRTILEAGDAGLDLAQRQHAAGNISDLDLANEQGSLRAGPHRPRPERRGSGHGPGGAHAAPGALGAGRGYRIVEKLPELPAEEVELDHLESLAVRPKTRPRGGP